MPELRLIHSKISKIFKKSFLLENFYFFAENSKNYNNSDIILKKISKFDDIIHE